MNIYRFNNFISFLQEHFPSVGSNRGGRLELAKYLNCQTSFISQVLTQKRNFSQEHAFKVARFLELDSEELDYYLLLFQLDRVATKELQRYYKQKIKDVQKNRQEIQSRIKKKRNIESEDILLFFSHWYYSAIHLLVTVDEYRTVDSITEKLKLPRQVVTDSLRFMCEKGFVEENKGVYSAKQFRLHLNDKSKFLGKHHLNWRIQAMNAIEARHTESENKHYSSIMSMSREAMDQLKEKLLQVVEDFEPIFQKSDVEEVVCFNFDVFKI